MRLGVPVASSLKDREAAADFVAAIPIGYARPHSVMGLAGTDLDPRTPLEVALGTIAAWPVLDVLGRFLRRPVRPLLVPATEILGAINAAYQQASDNSAHVVEGGMTQAATRTNSRVSTSSAGNRSRVLIRL